VTHAYQVDVEPPVAAPRTMTLRRVVPRVIAALVVLLLLAELFVRLVENRLPPPPKWPTKEIYIKEQRLGKLAKAGGASVVIIGSSVVDISVDPARFSPAGRGKRGGYNASLIGVGPIVVDIWTRLLVQPKLRPDTVVIGISSRDVNANSSVGTGAEGFVKTPGAKHLLGTETAADKVKRELSERSALVRYRQVLRQPAEALLHYQPPKELKLGLTPQGLETHLLGVNMQDTPEVRAFFHREPLHNFALSPAALRAIERLAAFLEKGGTRVILLDVPVTNLYVQLHPKGIADYQAYESAINDVATRTGAELVHAGTWDPLFFSDPLHLNRAGMVRLTRVLDAHLSAK
jgi:hypothetical protein